MVFDFTKLLVRGRMRRAHQQDADRRKAIAPGADQIVVGSTESGTAVCWPQTQLGANTHVLVLGQSGCGKTVATCAALLAEIANESCTKPPALSTAYFVTDPKGDLSATLLSGLAAEAPQLLSRVHYLDPFSPNRGFPFNLARLKTNTTCDILAVQLAELVNELSTATGSQAHLGTGARQVDILCNLLLACLDSRSEGASPLWALDALCAPRGMKELAAATRSQRARQFLLSADRLSDQLVASTSARLRMAFALTEHIEQQMAASSCIQFSELLAPGSIVIADLGNPPAGMASITRYYANLLVRLVIQYLLERPSPWQGNCVRLVIDESQIVVPVIASVAQHLLETARSRGISLTLMTQGTATIRKEAPTLLASLMTNVKTIFAGRLSAQDAEALSRELSPSPGVEQSVSSLRQKFVARTTNLAQREFVRLGAGERSVFRSNDVPLDAWQEAARARADELTAVKERLNPELGTGPRPPLPLLSSAERKPKPKAPAGKRPPPSLWG
jgi:hypothetical protein